MRVFNLEFPDKPLTKFELSVYARELGIPHFRCVFMGDPLLRQQHSVECGIVNLDTSTQFGRHWVCYYQIKGNRIYFDSFGQITAVEIQRCIKTGTEFASGREVIQRNTDIVQATNTRVCGHLCLFALKSLANGEHYGSGYT